MILETLDDINVAINNYLTNKEYSLIIHTRSGLLHYPIIKTPHYEASRLSKDNIKKIIDEHLDEYYICVSYDPLVYHLNGKTFEALNIHQETNFAILDKNIAFTFVSRLLDIGNHIYAEYVF